MKINRLILSAFGSFSGEEVIDFRGVQGELFLISGDTGAGKTTILDAISYALFEETSGRVRDGSMMRSQYADADTPTYVKLEFEYRGETYVIKRNPTYKRQSKRRNQDGNYALTEEKASVELQLPDGTMYRGKKQEINRKIIEIIGITAKQFSSIVMIAQGKFTQLLFASSKERKEIFKELFDTEIYARIQEQLQDQAKDSAEKLKAFNMQYHTYMQSIRLPEDYSRAEEWEEALQYKTMDCTEQVNGMLDEIWQQSVQQAERGKAIQEAAKEQVAQMKVHLSRAEQELKWISQRELLKTQLEELECQKVQEDEKLAQIQIGERAAKVEPVYQAWKTKQQEQQICMQGLEETRQQQVQQEQAREQMTLTVKQLKDEGTEASEKLTPEIRQLEENLQQYTQVRTLQKELEQYAQKMQELKQQQELAVVKQKETADRMLQRKEQQQELSILANGYEAAKQLEQAVNQRLDKIYNLQKLWQKQERETAMESVYQAQLAAAEAEKRIAGVHYEQAMEQYISNQAGVLAKQLRPGQPCPVCGAVEHPHPAAETEEGISKEQLERFKQVREDAEQQYQKCAEEIHIWRQTLELRHRQLQRDGEELGLTDWLQQENVGGILAHTEQQAEQEVNIRKETRKQAEQAAKQLGDISRELPELDLKQRNCEQQMQNLETDRQMVHDQMVKLEAQISSLQKDFVFEDAEEAQQELRKKKKQLDAWADKIRAGEESLQKQQTEINRLLGIMEAKQTEQKRLTEEMGEKKAQYAQKLQQAGFESEAEFLQGCIDAGALEELRSEYHRYEQHCKDVQKEYEIAIREAGDKAPYEIETIRDALQEAVSKEQVAETAYQESAGRKQTNEGQILQLRKLQEQYRQEEAEFRVYETLSKTANGRLNQSVKLDFQTYIQRYYFCEMIRAANERLVEMTGGRLYLQCRDLKNLQTQGEAGLDLDIYSAELNQVRDVKTLSGGESFQAALAMAFGMADIIEKRVGRIQMDMLFIDEGFGSLDEDARRLAIEKLRSMTGRNQTVGIISHVAELRDEVEHLLYVKKDSHGSHASWKA